ncbi:MAG: hypothetical protein AB7O28_19365 [Vicinamibacterales bacterium]
MPTFLGRLLVAALLVAGALYAWGEATRLDATADAWYQLVALGNDVPPSPAPSRVLAWLPAALRPSTAVTDAQRATADYWLSRYEDLVRASGADPNPAVMLTAANAAYRVARQTGEVGAVAAKQLDGVLESYANVLKLDPESSDAAWNYEFVARARDIVARMRPVPPGRAAPVMIGLQPPVPGHTIHGLPGGPPPEAKGEAFETIAPMDFGDREAQPEAAPGTTIKRKG